MTDDTYSISVNVQVDTEAVIEELRATGAAFYQAAASLTDDTGPIYRHEDDGLYVRVDTVPHDPAEWLDDPQDGTTGEES
jgi:hypothetical protein